jgi:hypothetical protein
MRRIQASSSSVIGPRRMAPNLTAAEAGNKRVAINYVGSLRSGMGPASLSRTNSALGQVPASAAGILPRSRPMTELTAPFNPLPNEVIRSLCSWRELCSSILENLQKAIGPRTLYRWLKEPEFDAAYRAAKRAAFGQAVARLQQGDSAAATTLLKTMIEPNTPASVRVRAAECVLNHAMKAIEIEDIEARVSELERAADVSKDGRR